MPTRGRPGWILGLDCSAPRTCVILGRVGEHGEAELVVADERQDRANQTSVTLHERLRAALDQARIAPSELAALACGRGPGTFTGSRVAVATAQGLALGLQVPVIPVSTLAAVAASGPERGRILALLDARRDQVYGGVYALDNGEPSVCHDEQVAALSSLIASLPTDERELLDAAIGPGCEPYAEQLPVSLRARALPCPGPSALGLWRATLAARRHDGAVDPSELQVHYLRRSYAEMGINTPKRPVFKSPYV